MVNEFGGEGNYCSEYVDVYQIGDKEYYNFEESNTYTNEELMPRFKELFDEYEVEYLSNAEINELIKAEEEKYVPNGIPDGFCKDD